MSEAKCSIHLNVGGALYGCVLPGGHAGPHDFRTAARPEPETREPDGWVVDAPESLPSHVARRVVYWGPDAKRRANNRVQRMAEVFRAFAVANPVYLGAPAPAEATEASAPDGATWGDVRSGLRAELIAEGMPVTEATRLARKVVHRFTAAEATEGSES